VHRFPVETQAWRSAWEHVTPFLAFGPEVRRVIYTTNAIEALNRQPRKAIKTKGHFPNEDVAKKADLPRRHKRRAGLDQDEKLDGRAPRIQNPLRKPTTRLTTAYTVRRTPSRREPSTVECSLSRDATASLRCRAACSVLGLAALVDARAL
jgi:hypothetical protein